MLIFIKISQSDYAKILPSPFEPTEFHQIRQDKFENGGYIFSSSQILLLSQLPQKTKLTSKVIKINSK
jgi:hypothetical protein